ncbi:hypothetical protein TeGR_g11211, partial [Tetraparma gracilis]
YFKLSFQTKQELIEKGVCGDDVPECSESPNRGTCQKVIDGVEQFVSCGCCQRKPAAFPPPPGSAELDSNQWLNVSPKTTFVLDAGYGAEAPAGCEQPFTEYKHASQFSPYEPMARQVQDGADVANPAYKNGRYELDPYAFPVGVYTDSSDYSFTAEYSKIPASNRIPLSGIGIKTTSEDATCGSDFNAESVRTPESVGWSQCAPLGTLQSVAPLDVAKFAMITPQEIMQAQVGEIVTPENPNTGYAYQVGGEQLITTGTFETYPFGRIANPGDRTNDQITKPVLGWANKLFYGYSVKDWYLDNLPNNVYTDGNETQCVWGAVTDYAEDTTVPLTLRYPWWTRTGVEAFSLWLEGDGTLFFSDKWINANPTVFFSQSGSGDDVSLNEYTDLSNPCPAEMPKDKTPVRPSRFSTMWTSQFCECARGDCNRDGAQGILTPKQISIESLSSDRPMRAAETENGCNAEANSAKWITNKVWGCEAEEVLYGCRIHITQTDVTTSIDGGTTGRNDANQCLQPLSNFDFDISVFNSNPSTTESECWELDRSLSNCFYFDEDTVKPMAPALFSQSEYKTQCMRSVPNAVAKNGQCVVETSPSCYSYSSDTCPEMFAWASVDTFCQGNINDSSETKTCSTWQPEFLLGLTCTGELTANAKPNMNGGCNVDPYGPAPTPCDPVPGKPTSCRPSPGALGCDSCVSSAIFVNEAENSMTEVPIANRKLETFVAAGQFKTYQGGEAQGTADEFYLTVNHNTCAGPGLARVERATWYDFLDILDSGEYSTEAAQQLNIIAGAGAGDITCCGGLCADEAATKCVNPVSGGECRWDLAKGNSGVVRKLMNKVAELGALGRSELVALKQIHEAALASLVIM